MNRVSAELIEAAATGNQVYIEQLLHHSDCDAKSTGAHGWTALMWAAVNGHAACIQLLIPFSDVLAKNDNGMTALIWAALNGHTSCVQHLLPLSDVSMTDKWGHSASSRAANQSYNKLAQLIDAHILAMTELALLNSLTSLATNIKPCSSRL